MMRRRSPAAEVTVWYVTTFHQRRLANIEMGLRHPFLVVRHILDLIFSEDFLHQTKLRLKTCISQPGLSAKNLSHLFNTGMKKFAVPQVVENTGRIYHV